MSVEIMPLETLLNVLADGEYHSGQELGEQLGVSRSAVWKQLKKLDALGVELYSIKGRGYRIPGGLDLLRLERFEGLLASVTRDKLSNIDLMLSTESTNVAATEAVRHQHSHGSLFVAERQTAGKGRRGRHWVSPFAHNLYFSLVWTFSGGAAALEGLSLAVGVAIVNGLQRYGVQNARVKWPNDVLWQERKLAGVLLEMTGDASGLCQVVIGVGVNVTMPESLAKEIDQPWVGVADIVERATDRNALLACLIDALVSSLARFSENGFQEFRDEWHGLNAFAGRSVCLDTGTQRFVGLCRGVSDSGALLLETDEGVQAFYGGEASLRCL